MASFKVEIIPNNDKQKHNLAVRIYGKNPGEKISTLKNEIVFTPETALLVADRLRSQAERLLDLRKAQSEEQAIDNLDDDFFDENDKDDC